MSWLSKLFGGAEREVSEKASNVPRTVSKTSSCAPSKPSGPVRVRPSSVDRVDLFLPRDYLRSLREGCSDTEVMNMIFTTFNPRYPAHVCSSGSVMGTSTNSMSEEVLKHALSFFTSGRSCFLQNGSLTLRIGGDICRMQAWLCIVFDNSATDGESKLFMTDDVKNITLLP